MLHSRIDFNEDIATNVRLFNPFGPNMFYMSLKDRHTAELLEIINKLSSQQDIKDKLNAIGQIVHGTKGKENQKNSIVDGEMYPIRTEFLEEKEVMEYDKRSSKNKNLISIDRKLNTKEGTYMQPMLIDQIRYLQSMLSRADQKPGKDAYNRLKKLKSEFNVLKEKLG